MEKVVHNLDISQYSLTDIFELFNISSYEISIDELKNAKKMVLMIHPDKTKLPSDYFLFYKKAFDILYDFYKNKNKMNEDVSNSNKNTQYSHVSSHATQNTYDKSIHKQINSTMKELTFEEYNRNFNKLFEKMEIKKYTNKNEWFSKDEPAIIVPSTSVNSSNINSVFENMKIKNNNEVVVHGNPVELHTFIGESFYEDDIRNEVDGETNTNYVQCDPFSKLKFDDLRKVHKDKTVFDVGEQDYKNIVKYKDVNSYKNFRNTQELNPLCDIENKKIFDEKERIMKERTYRLRHANELRNQEFTEKNKSVIASFLRLGPISMG